MHRQPSLTLRLSIYLLAGQLLCFAAVLIGNHLIGLIGENPLATLNWHYLAEMRARTLVVQSLVRAPGGSVILEPTPELRALVEKHPTLQFAAFVPDTGTALPGSSPELAASLSGHGHIVTKEMALFQIRGIMNKELSGSYLSQDTSHGTFLIATHGYIFEWRDLFYHLYNDLVGTFTGNSPTIIISVAIGWFTLRRGLAPLEGVVQQARRIDLSSLDQRIPFGGIPREITPLVETINEALARLDAGVTQQNRFHANAAHELRTPLTIMTARINSPEKPTFRQDLDRDVRRLRNIVEQLLVYAKIGKSDSALEDIDLVELTQAIVDDHALVAVKNLRSLEFQSERETMPIRGDRHALESVVSNLIDNALRAEPEGGTVLARVGPGARLEVIDHGDGVEQDDRDTIFEPFWRKSEASPGTGLGLAIAKEIVAAHGGTIGVTDTPGGGATFGLSFR